MTLVTEAQAEIFELERAILQDCQAIPAPRDCFETFEDADLADDLTRVAVMWSSKKKSFLEMLLREEIAEADAQAAPFLEYAKEDYLNNKVAYYEAAADQAQSEGVVLNI